MSIQKPPSLSRARYSIRAVCSTRIGFSSSSFQVFRNIEKVSSPCASIAHSPPYTSRIPWAIKSALERGQALARLGEIGGHRLELAIRLFARHRSGSFQSCSRRFISL